jgi:hypothetical protein
MDTLSRILVEYFKIPTEKILSVGLLALLGFLMWRVDGSLMELTTAVRAEQASLERLMVRLETSGNPGTNSKGESWN